MSHVFGTNNGTCFVCLFAQSYVGGLSSPVSCMNQGWSYNAGTFSLTFTNVYDHSTSQLLYSCPGFSLVAAGFNPGYPTTDYSVTVDIRSTMSVAALKRGVFKHPTKNLLNVTNKLYFLDMSNPPADLHVIYDEKYPDMEAVLHAQPHFTSCCSFKLGCSFRSTRARRGIITSALGTPWWN